MNAIEFKIYAVFVALVLLINQSIANQDSNNITTLDECLVYAALNNPQLKSEFDNWKASLEQIPQVNVLPDPKFTYSYFIQEVETRVGPQRNRFSISQTFPWFGKIQAMTDAASANSKSAWQRYQKTKLALFFDVKKSYYDIVYLDYAIQISKENYSLLELFEQIVQTKYRSMELDHPDLIRAQIELAKIDDVVKSLTQFREPTSAKLNFILGRNGHLNINTKIEYIEIPLNKDDIITKVIANNPELKEIDWQKQAAEARLEAAKKKFYPDFNIGLDWIETDKSSMSGVNDSGKDPVMLMFAVNIPLWQESYKAATRQANSEISHFKSKKLDAQNQKIYETVDLIYQIQDSKRKYQLYCDVLVPKSEKLLEYSQSAYRSGVLDFLSLIDSLRTLLRYKLDCQKALIDYNTNIAQLETLTAENISILELIMELKILK